jgi:hypothetical protein
LRITRGVNLRIKLTAFESNAEKERAQKGRREEGREEERERERVKETLFPLPRAR